jgi:hypothetical protein
MHRAEIRTRAHDNMHQATDINAVNKKSPANRACHKCHFRQLTRKPTWSSLHFKSYLSSYFVEFYLASFAIWWVRRETFRLALFL